MEKNSLEIKKTLAHLIRLETVSKTSNIKIINYLESIATNLGFSCHKISHPKDPERANLLCRIGPEDKSGLLISGHTDVVPVTDQQWDTNPFELTQIGSRYYGRGTTDMKGFIASCIHALSKLDLNKLKKNLVLLWTYDEEIGCQGSFVAAPQLNNFLPAVPKFGIIGEPTDFNILRMHSGHATVLMTARGKGAHSSDPSLGVSAIKAMSKAMRGIFEFEETLKQEKILPKYFDKPWVSLNIGTIFGGTAVNIIPDYCEIMLGFRPLPDTCVNTIFERLTNYANKYLDSQDASLDLKLSHVSPPLFTREKTEIERIISPYARNNKTSAANFSTDAGNLSTQGVECLIFGPGSISIAHQANEFVEKRDLEQASEKLQKIITNYCMN